MVILMSIILWQMQLDRSIKQKPFLLVSYAFKRVVHDGCIWLVACHKIQKAEIRKMKLLAVIGRGHKTLMHIGVGV
jgi:hypothetical protein